MLFRVDRYYFIFETKKNGIDVRGQREEHGQKLNESKRWRRKTSKYEKKRERESSKEWDEERDDECSKMTK